MRRLAAFAGALALIGAGTLAIAAPATASARHVGVVVRYGNGRVSAGCATVGGTGLGLLEQHHSVRMGTQQYSGFVIEVDGVGTARPDDTHYWSYWHSGGKGGWRYASSGAASYRPKAGTVEGWSYVNGQGSAPRPPSRTYAALCGHLDPHAAPHTTAPATTAPRTPAPSTTAPHPAMHSAMHSATHPARHSPAHSASHSPAVTSAVAPAPHATPRSASNRAHRRAPRSPARSVTARHGSPAVAAPSAAPTAPAPSSAPSIAAQPAADTSGTNAWPTVGGLAVVAALGVTAWLVMRRRAG